MKLGTKIKQSIDVLDYDIDYSGWLPPGDYIINATVGVTPNTLAIATVLISSSGDAVKVWTEDGVNGTTYKVEVTAITHGGRKKQDELYIKIKDV